MKEHPNGKFFKVFKDTIDLAIQGYPEHLQGHVMQAYVLSLIGMDLKRAVNKLNEVTDKLDAITDILNHLDY